MKKEKQFTLLPNITKETIVKEGKNKNTYGDKGIYNTRNQLNDLTGKEWKFYTRSVITKSYPPGLQMDLRKQHGGQKPPELCADLIKVFSKKGDLVFDPLMGVGGTLLGASLCERKALGFEINSKWIQIYKEVCKLENLEEHETRCGDSRILMKNLESENYDLVLTDVPYWNMDKLKHTRSVNGKKSNLKSFNDTPSKSKSEWLQEMKEIFVECTRILKTNHYLLIFIGDLYRDKEYHILSAELAFKLKEISNLTLKANLIWYDVSKSLHVYGYPYQFVPSMIHQNILVFRKE